MNRIKKGVILGIASVTLVGTGALAAVLLQSVPTTTTVSMATKQVRAYEDASCTVQIYSLDFGTNEAGDNIYRDFWLRNEGRKTITLQSTIIGDTTWATIVVEPIPGIEPITLTPGQIQLYRVWETINTSTLDGTYTYTVDFYEN